MQSACSICNNKRPHFIEIGPLAKCIPLVTSEEFNFEISRTGNCENDRSIIATFFVLFRKRNYFGLPTFDQTNFNIICREKTPGTKSASKRCLRICSIYSCSCCEREREREIERQIEKERKRERGRERES
jgi:hypothetical protein